MESWSFQAQAACECQGMQIGRQGTQKAPQKLNQVLQHGSPVPFPPAPKLSFTSAVQPENGATQLLCAPKCRGCVTPVLSAQVGS